LGRAEVGQVVENEVIHMDWLNECTMVRMFACAECAAKYPGIKNTILLPRAVEVFKTLLGTAPTQICFLTETAGT